MLHRLAADRQYLKGVLLVLLATLLWSLSGIFVRLTLTSDMWQIASFRAGSTALTLFLFLAATYGRGVLGRFTALAPGALLASAGFFAVGSPLYVISLTLTSVANVACIGATTPIFAAVLARLFAGERAGSVSWVAALAALAGVFVIFRQDLGAGGQLGNAIALAVALFFAGQTVVLRKFRAADMVPAICLGAVATCLIAGAIGGFRVPETRDLLLLALMGAVQLAAPLVLYARGARYVPAVQLALLAMLDVVLNPLWAWVGAGERPSAAAFLGGGVIVAAVLGVTMSHARLRGRLG